MTNMSNRLNYKEGDLVWAKIRGFPPWPALITNAPPLADFTEAGTKRVGKYEVRFLGTGETAAVKAAELFNYHENWKLFGVERKQKGFNEAIREAQIVAAHMDQAKRRPSRRVSRKTSTESSSYGSPTRSNDSPSSLVGSSEGPAVTPPRLRRASHSSAEGISRDHSLSGNGPLGSAMGLKSALAQSGVGSRTESTTSSHLTVARPKRIKRVSYSDKVAYSTDPHHHQQQQHRPPEGTSTSFSTTDPFDPMSDPVLSSGADPLFSFLDLDQHQLGAGLGSLGDDGSMRRSGRKRRRSSRLFDDFMTSNHTTPSRKAGSKSPSSSRSRSISSVRSRLVSGGLSDAFDELLEAAHMFNPNELMAAIDQLPSEEDRPPTPEEPLHMPAPLKRCFDCGCQCDLLGNSKWRCTNRSCQKWNGVHQPLSHKLASTTLSAASSPFSHLSSSPERRHPLLRKPSESGSFSMTINEQVVIVGPTSDDEGSKAVGRAQHQQHRVSPQKGAQHHGRVPYSRGTRFQTVDAPSASPPRAALATPSQRRQPKDGKPRVYKVEKTPPMTANGRLCVMCNGQVRPQMCGGNKHRWRCVDKRCRKWYGWVRLTDEIPPDLGKKGWYLKIHNHEQQRRQRLGPDSADDAEPQITTGLTPKALLEGVVPPEELDLNTSPAVQKPKRKYARRKRADDLIEPHRAISPLTLLQQSYEPSKMENKGRWWLSTNYRGRGNASHSPVRSIASSALNTAAAMRTIGAAMSTAATTRADESGSVNGTLDLLMDTMISSMAPLLTLVERLPQVGSLDDGTANTLNNASLPHTPTFQ